VLAVPLTDKRGMPGLWILAPLTECAISHHRHGLQFAWSAYGSNTLHGRIRPSASSRVAQAKPDQGSAGQGEYSDGQHGHIQTGCKGVTETRRHLFD
jgi:hypothetical protein